MYDPAKHFSEKREEWSTATRSNLHEMVRRSSEIKNAIENMLKELSREPDARALNAEYQRLRDQQVIATYPNDPQELVDAINALIVFGGNLEYRLRPVRLRVNS